MRWPTDRAKRRVWPHLVVLVLFCSLPSRLGEAQLKLKRLLIVYEVGTSYPGINLIDQGIREVLDTSPDKLETYREYMDTILFPNPSDQRKFRDFYIRKYRTRKPDVIVTVGPSPLKFMVEEHTKAFPNIPIVFCMPAWGTGTPTLSSEFTGVASESQAGETVAAALRLQPSTQNIVVVGGTSYIDKSYIAVRKEQLRPFERNYQIVYLTNFAMPDLIERLKHLPNRTIVLYGSFSQDATGAKFTSAEASAIVTAAASVPVFSLASDVEFGEGQVGGKLVSLREQGRLAGGLVQRLLNGERPQAIPVVKSPSVYMFDWRALNRWGFKEGDLPPGSIVVNRPFSVWNSYKEYIAGGIGLMLIEALLISGLLWQSARRRQTSRALEKREELLKIFVKNVPAGAAMLDRDMRYLQVSDRWCADYRVDPSQILGCSHYEVFPDMPDRWREKYRRALDGETLLADEDCWDRRGGALWVRWEVRPWQNVDGQTAGILIFSEDITRRKQADEALSSMTRKVIESQEQERARIGRELHDDINQRLALLAVELDQWNPSSPLDPNFRHKEQVKQQILDISQDVQDLSHQLHSSKLEYLGLAAAARSLCKEISEKRSVQIDFKQDGTPHGLSTEISVGLFRVLQEALQNAMKHSSADHLDVELCGVQGEIQLIVRDYGKGFNVEGVTPSQGLGLLSMRERISALQGTLMISSKPLWGTEIAVRVPIRADCAHQVNLGAA